MWLKWFHVLDVQTGQRLPADYKAKYIHTYSVQYIIVYGYNLNNTDLTFLNT